VTTSDGREHRYAYTDRHEMVTISDPDILIENTYDTNGRCVRQVNHFPDDPESYAFDFAYIVKDGAVIQTDTKRSDGTWTRYTYGPTRYITSETWGSGDLQPATFAYKRDAVTNSITALTLTCPDRAGRPIRHASQVRFDNEDWIKWDLLRTNCSWRHQPARGVS
jgi:YD repeat-containing protein